MKFIVKSSSLLKHLQSISGVINTSNTLPILDDFLFEVQSKSLRITASDLETTIITNLAVESKEEMEIAIPAKLLLDILKSFPDHPLTFSIEKEIRALRSRLITVSTNLQATTRTNSQKFLKWNLPPQ